LSHLELVGPVFCGEEPSFLPFYNHNKSRIFSSGWENSNLYNFAAQGPQTQPKNPFFACFWAFVGQSLNHIGWATTKPFASINPEVSWVRPILEGMEGFPSPFESLRTILKSLFCGIARGEIQSYRKATCSNLVLLTFIKQLLPPGIEPGSVNQMSDALSDELLMLGWGGYYFLRL
jgi:hypothetical protein